MKIEKYFNISVLIVLALAGLIAYSNTFDASFHIDDLINIVSNENVHMEEFSLGRLLKSKVDDPNASIFVRPVAYMSFALNYYFGGLDVFGYHLVNIIIHIVAGLGVYLLIKATVELSGRGISRGAGIGNPAVLAAFAAILWLISPVQTQAVTYIVQRMASMAALFYIWSLLFYVKGRMADTWERRTVWFSLSIFLFLLALGTKQNSLTLPFMLLLYELCFFRRDFQQITREKSLLLTILASFIILAGFLYLLREHLDPGVFFEGGYATRERIYTGARVIIFYIILMLIPVPSKMAFYHDFSFSRGLLTPITTLTALLFIVGMMAVCLYRMRRDPLVSFFTLWFFVGILPETLYGSISLVFEHRLYLPSVGFYVVIAILMMRMYNIMGGKGRFLFYITGVLVPVLFSVNTYARNTDWHDPVSLWADNVKKYPTLPSVREGLGMAHLERGEFEKAEIELRAAMRLDPLSPAGIGIGIISYNRGDYMRALMAFEDVVSRTGRGAGLSHMNMDEVFLKMSEEFLELGRWWDAVKVLRLGLKLNPNNERIKIALLKIQGG